MFLQAPVVSAVLIVMAVVAAVRVDAATLGPIETVAVSPVRLYSPRTINCCLRLAMDASGNTVFVWKTGATYPGAVFSAIHTRTRSANAALGPVQIVASEFNGQTYTAPLGGADVAMDGRGSAIIAWGRHWPLYGPQRESAIDVRRLSPRGVLGSIETIASGFEWDPPFPSVAASANGHFVVSWVREDDAGARLQARMRSAGVFGPLQEIAPLPSADFGYGRAVAGDGHAIFGWSSPPEDTGTRIQFRLIPFAGDASRVRSLSGGRREHGPIVRIDPAGNAVFAWVRSARDSSRYVQTRVRSSDGTLGPVQVVSLRSTDSRVYGHNLAVAADGTAVYTWLLAGSDTAAPQVQARIRSATGDLGPIANVGVAASASWPPRVAVDAVGNAVFAWIRRDGQIQSRTLSASGVLGAAETISPPSVSSPWLVGDTAGNVLFAWMRSDGTNSYVETRVRAAD